MCKPSMQRVMLVFSWPCSHLSCINLSGFTWSFGIIGGLLHEEFTGGIRVLNCTLSYDVASPCIKIDKPLVVYKWFTDFGNVMYCRL